MSYQFQRDDDAAAKEVASKTVSIMEKNDGVHEDRRRNRNAGVKGQYGFSRLLQKCHREGYNRKEK